jgi:hypothetical protein
MFHGHAGAQQRGIFMRQVIGLMAALALLAGCGGGMTRAVTTLPNTFDDLGAKSAALRGEKVPAPAAAPAPAKPAG